MKKLKQVLLTTGMITLSMSLFSCSSKGNNKENQTSETLVPTKIASTASTTLLPESTDDVTKSENTKLDFSTGEHKLGSIIEDIVTYEGTSLATSDNSWEYDFDYQGNLKRMDIKKFNELSKDVSNDSSIEGDNQDDWLDSYKEQSTITILENVDCKNLNEYKDKVIFTDNGELYICDLDGKNKTKMNILTEYKIEMLYVVDDEYLLFLSNGCVYQYNIEQDAIINYDKKNVQYIIPTEYGIIYVCKNAEGLSDLFAEDNIVIKNININDGLGVFLEDDGYYLQFNYSKYEFDEREIKIEDIFNNFSEDKIKSCN